MPFIVIPFKLPLNHLIAPGTSYWLALSNKKEIAAWSIACIPIPININLLPEKLISLDSKYISIDTKSPDITEIIETAGPLNPSTNIQKTAATLEPDVTPIISGLARGFLSIVWNVFPAIPNAIPTNNPLSILGRRNVAIAKLAPWIFSPLNTLITTSNE